MKKNIQVFEGNLRLVSCPEDPITKSEIYIDNDSIHRAFEDLGVTHSELVLTKGFFDEGYWYLNNLKKVRITIEILD